MHGTALATLEWAFWQVIKTYVVGEIRSQMKGVSSNLVSSKHFPDEVAVVVIEVV